MHPSGCFSNTIFSYSVHGTSTYILYAWIHCM
nr:MAG TPA: hypothetical protein [Caudoviricetes sp.]